MDQSVQIPELPEQLVDRLTQIFSWMDCRKQHSWKRFLGALENADYRYESPKGGILHYQDPRSTRNPGLRVRRFDVHRNYPDFELILKRTHDYNARKTLSIIDEQIERCRESDSDIVRIPAAPVADKIIAMTKVEAPCLKEMFPFGNQYWNATSRGIRYRKAMEEADCVAAFCTAVDQIERVSDVTPGNLLYLGMHDGHFVFAPLMDVR